MVAAVTAGQIQSEEWQVRRDVPLIQMIPWNEEEPPKEEELRRQFEVEGLRASSWSTERDELYDARTHVFHKVLCVLEGDITFSMPELGEEITLRPGDRLELSPGVLHQAFVGPSGVLCLEGQRL
jgi:quercetin dioxygenase-like cupin family protein